VNYRIVKAFFEELDRCMLRDMAQFPVFADFVRLLANKDVTKVGDRAWTRGMWEACRRRSYTGNYGGRQRRYHSFSGGVRRNALRRIKVMCGCAACQRAEP
jgi:hypothetical protein